MTKTNELDRFVAAINQGDVIQTRRMLAEQQLDVNECTSSGQLPLMAAIEFRSGDIVQLLIERGADVSIKLLSDSGTPWDDIVNLAMFDDCPVLLVACLRGGVSPDTLTSDRRTPLMCAAMSNIWMMKELISFGADPHYEVDGMTALRYAAMIDDCHGDPRNAIDRVQFLLDLGMRPDSSTLELAQSQEFHPKISEQIVTLLRTRCEQ